MLSMYVMLAERLMSDGVNWIRGGEGWSLQGFGFEEDEEDGRGES